MQQNQDGKLNDQVQNMLDKVGFPLMQRNSMLSFPSSSVSTRTSKRDSIPKMMDGPKNLNNESKPEKSSDSKVQKRTLNDIPILDIKPSDSEKKMNSGELKNVANQSLENYIKTESDEEPEFSDVSLKLHFDQKAKIKLKKYSNSIGLPVIEEITKDTYKKSSSSFYGQTLTSVNFFFI